MNAKLNSITLQEEEKASAVKELLCCGTIKKCMLSQGKLEWISCSFDYQQFDAHPKKAKKISKSESSEEGKYYNYKLDEFIQLVSETESSRSVRGKDFFGDFEERLFYLPTGHSRLDDILNGGFSSCEITEIVGKGGAGKTSLCFSVVLQTCLRQRNVIFIDTENNFSAQRLIEMNHSRTEIQNPLGDGVKVLKVYDIYTLFDALYDIFNSLSGNCENNENFLFFLNLKGGCVIIDCIATLLSPSINISESTKKKSFGQGPSIINNVGRLLKRIAVEFGIVVVVTNFTLNDFESKKSKPGLGVTWLSIADTRLFVEASSRNNVMTKTFRVNKISGKNVNCIIEQ